jgi:Fe2+ or Zn2+ uptake regulation protein
MTLRITQKRQQILDVLKKQHDTLSAAQIHTNLPQIDLVTIYRNLDLFVKEKLIKQIHLGKDEAQYEYQHESHHHAVCGECEKVIHFTAPEAKIIKLLGLEDFKVDEIEVTARGICNPKNRIV